MGTDHERAIENLHARVSPLRTSDGERVLGPDVGSACWARCEGRTARRTGECGGKFVLPNRGEMISCPKNLSQSRTSSHDDVPDHNEPCGGPRRNRARTGLTCLPAPAGRGRIRRWVEEIRGVAFGIGPHSSRHRRDKLRGTEVNTHGRRHPARRPSARHPSDHTISPNSGSGRQLVQGSACRCGRGPGHAKQRLKTNAKRR